LFQRTLFSETVCSGRENFRIDLFTILIDESKSDLEFRCNAHKNTWDSLGVSGKVHEENGEELIAGGKNLIQLCNEDLEPSFIEELVNVAVYFITLWGHLHLCKIHRR